MIVLRTGRELAVMREACKISANALKLAGEMVKPGVSTWEIDREVRGYIEKMGATPSFLDYPGPGGKFPASTCISVNEVVIHGIPSKKQILKEGDIVDIDIGAYYKGFHGDNAWTFPCGRIDDEAQRLLDVTRECLFRGIEQARPGNRIGDIGYGIQGYAEACNYSVVREFIGHGVGARLHEEPNVPNFGRQGRGGRLLPGMTIAIEPMINQGTEKVLVKGDGWTTVTGDGKLSAHFEHTIAITENGPVIMTEPD